MKKVCFLTGTRAEYGLLKWLMKDLSADSSFKVDILVTGTHLSPHFGNTYKEIEEDGLKISRKIEILDESTTIQATADATAKAVSGVAEALLQIKPDLLILLGDRYEALAAAVAATLCRVPIAHIHGGELTEGAIDDVFRHSITKMSHLHFTALPEYQKRVIQMGEDPSRVFCVGGLGVDAIKRIQLMSKDELETSLGFKFSKRNLLVTLHPTTLDSSISTFQAVSNLLQVLDELENVHYIFTGANADPDGMLVNEAFKDFVLRNPERSVFVDSLGQRRYFSAVACVDAVVGNSSSGLLEVPSFHVGTLNIGNRQKGRIRAESVIDCAWEKESLQKCLDKMLSSSFKEDIAQVRNPYGHGAALLAIKEVLLQTNLSSLVVKKFYDR